MQKNTMNAGESSLQESREDLLEGRVFSANRGLAKVFSPSPQKTKE